MTPDPWHELLRTIPSHLRDAAVQHVKQAAHDFTLHATRRAWAVDQLVTSLGVPESIARLVVELAVSSLRREGEILPAGRGDRD